MKAGLYVFWDLPALLAFACLGVFTPCSVGTHGSIEYSDCQTHRPHSSLQQASAE